MEGSKRMFSTVFILVLLLVAIGTGPMVAEGKVETKETSRTCESLSTKFKGPCFRSSNCANICEKEGFKGGKCVGFRLRCTCTKKC
ncbi:defensin Ec-AMP-D1-like [Prunus dulcis]|uniref:defensin Ec-AMP-D1-like n=1 Tax=Prunus dulcis TaxID=3755 RepID=UPI001482FB7E|nr:defensin Ec-AMP-D1-like [Prunus dulcis]XP_034225018.1 defensin Ec-AMP-D1-like [Prunus dulcis]XP_034226438.1 defensin Ec-AMP-D1-like [Prunus dulcis]XP_034226556.1 defensin Ec-AMP-D1-like [Prunus dulcis]